MGNFNMLPSDITLDILSRLPTESVLDCKLVSKPLRNLIKRPSFAQIHFNGHIDSGESSFIFLNRQPEREQGLNEFYFSEYDENCHESPFHRNPRINLSPPLVKYSLAASCNGLLLFNACVEDERGRVSYEPAYICNPITRECITLPRSKGKYMWTGFGYIPSTNEYKVVRIHNSGRRSIYEEIVVGVIQVYTLGSVSGWRDVGTIDIIMQYLVRTCDGVFANGALHWVNVHQEGNTIFAFDLADEKFTVLPSPPPCLTLAEVPYMSMRLWVLGDYLSATFYYNANSEIWFWKKSKDNCDGLGWSKEFHLDGYISQAVGFTKSGRLLCHGYGKIFSYNPEASSAKMDVSFGKHISETIPHKNTLVSLKELGETDTKTMEYVESVSSIKETENADTMKKPQNKASDC